MFDNKLKTIICKTKVAKNLMDNSWLMIILWITDQSDNGYQTTPTTHKMNRINKKTRDEKI